MHQTSPASTLARNFPAYSWPVWVGLGAGIVLLGGLSVVFGPRLFGRSTAVTSASMPSHAEGAALPVNVVSPKRQTLVRTFEQPGSVEAWARAELFAKVPGYLKWIARDLPPPLAARLAAHSVAAFAAPHSLRGAGQLCLEGWAVQRDAPEKDIGARVAAGELLLEIDAPELLQEVEQRRAGLEQSQAELEQARRNLATFEAAIESSKALARQAEADVKRCESELSLHLQKLRRTQDLARDRTVASELVDEQQNQVNAARAALGSSVAKTQASQSELSVALSKFAASRAEVLVRESRVRVTQEDLQRARIQADYVHLRAPFAGIITSRDVDAGDFVQNASSGQARRLLTVIAIDRVKVVLQVPEQEAIWVRAGTEAVLEVDAHHGRRTQGRVARVGPSLDVNARTRRVEIDLDNGDGQLLPGMYGQVVLVLQNLENALAIPATAVFGRSGETYVILVKDGVTRRQRVRIRYDDGKLLEVVQRIGGKEVPLDGTEELVVSNKGEIADGQRVRATHSDGR